MRFTTNWTILLTSVSLSINIERWIRSTFESWKSIWRFISKLSKFFWESAESKICVIISFSQKRLTIYNSKSLKSWCRRWTILSIRLKFIWACKRYSWKKTQRFHDRSTWKKLSRSSFDFSKENDETNENEKKNEKESFNSNDDDDEKEIMQSFSRTRKRAKA
jgi:hypothetical protein